MGFLGRMARVQWRELVTPRLNFSPRKAGTAQNGTVIPASGAIPKPEPKPLPAWVVKMPDGTMLRVNAVNKSDAGARAKELQALDRLPPGSVVTMSNQ